jgi:hypothetical protein
MKKLFCVRLNDGRGVICPPSPTKKKTNDKALFFEVGWFLVYPRHRHERHFRANCILLNGGQDQEGKKRTGRGGSKEEGESGGTSSPCRGHSFFKGGRGESNNTFPIGKKKGIGWRPQKNTGALSSRRAARTVGIFFSFERRIKNRASPFFPRGVRLHRRVIWFFLSMPLPFCSKKKDRGYKNSSEACGRFECMQVSQKRRSVTGNVFFKYG